MVDALKLCAHKVLPTLFPFMVLSEMALSCSSQIKKGRLYTGLDAIMQKLFCVHGAGFSALLFGVLCGAPVGAKAALTLYRTGELSKEDCERVLCFCNYPSVPFVVFVVGGGMLGDRKTGLFLYISILMSGIISGILFGKLWRGRRTESFCPLHESSLKGNFSFFSALSSSLRSSSLACLYVTAFVAFFSSLTSCLDILLSPLLPPHLLSLIICVFEMTSGAAAAATSGGWVGALTSAAALGWGGVSVHLQIMSLFDKSDISFRKYIASKLLSSVLSAAFFAVFLVLVPLKTFSFSPSISVFNLFPSTHSALEAFRGLSFLFGLCLLLYQKT